MWMSVEICQFVNTPTSAKFKLPPGREGTQSWKVMRRAGLLSCKVQVEGGCGGRGPVDLGGMGVLWILTWSHPHSHM